MKIAAGESSARKFWRFVAVMASVSLLSVPTGCLLFAAGMAEADTNHDTRSLERVIHSFFSPVELTLRPGIDHSEPLPLLLLVNGLLWGLAAAVMVTLLRRPILKTWSILRHASAGGRQAGIGGDDSGGSHL